MIPSWIENLTRYTQGLKIAKVSSKRLANKALKKLEQGQASLLEPQESSWFIKGPDVQTKIKEFAPAWDYSSPEAAEQSRQLLSFLHEVPQYQPHISAKTKASKRETIKELLRLKSDAATRLDRLKIPKSNDEDAGQRSFRIAVVLANQIAKFVTSSPHDLEDYMPLLSPMGAASIKALETLVDSKDDFQAGLRPKSLAVQALENMPRPIKTKLSKRAEQLFPQGLPEVGQPAAEAGLIVPIALRWLQKIPGSSQHERKVLGKAVLRLVQSLDHHIATEVDNLLKEKLDPGALQRVLFSLRFLKKNNNLTPNFDALVAKAEKLDPGERTKDPQIQAYRATQEKQGAVAWAGVESIVNYIYALDNDENASIEKHEKDFSEFLSELDFQAQELITQISTSGKTLKDAGIKERIDKLLPASIPPNKRNKAGLKEFLNSVEKDGRERTLDTAERHSTLSYTILRLFGFDETSAGIMQQLPQSTTHYKNHEALIKHLLANQVAQDLSSDHPQLDPLDLGYIAKAIGTEYLIKPLIWAMNQTEDINRISTIAEFLNRTGRAGDASNVFDYLTGIVINQEGDYAESFEDKLQAHNAIITMARSLNNNESRERLARPLAEALTNLAKDWTSSDEIEIARNFAMPISILVNLVSMSGNTLKMSVIDDIAAGRFGRGLLRTKAQKFYQDATLYWDKPLVANLPHNFIRLRNPIVPSNFSVLSN